MATFRELLAAAKQPLVILGGGGWDAKACDNIRAFVEANHLPVTTAFRNQDLIDNRHDNFVGDLGLGVNPPLGKRIKESDLIIAIGPRLGEATTGGYTMFDLPVPAQKMVHVHAGAEELGPRLPGDPADQLGHGAVRRRGEGDEAGRCLGMESGRARGPCRLPEEHRADTAARFRQSRGDRGLAEQAPARRRDRHQRCRQLCRFRAPLLPVSRLPHPARADQRLDGLRRAVGRWRRRSQRPAAPSCRSVAMAAS